MWRKVRIKALILVTNNIKVNKDLKVMGYSNMSLYYVHLRNIGIYHVFFKKGKGPPIK